MEAFFAASLGVRPDINLALLPPQYSCLAGLIEKCWHSSSKARPPAQEIVTTLLSLQQQLGREKEMASSNPSPPAERAAATGHASRVGMTGVMIRGTR